MPSIAQHLQPQAKNCYSTPKDSILHREAAPFGPSKQLRPGVRGVRKIMTSLWRRLRFAVEQNMRLVDGSNRPRMSVSHVS